MNRTSRISLSCSSGSPHKAAKVFESGEKSDGFPLDDDTRVTKPLSQELTFVHDAPSVN